MLKLRDAIQPSDRAPLEGILRGVEVFPPHEVDVALELIDEGLQANEDEYRFVVAEEEDKVLGYACYGQTPMTDAVFDLYWIVVARDAHRHGVGRKLLEKVRSNLRIDSARWLLIETEGTEPYAPTRAFYRSAGFEELARIPDFYRVGADKIVFGARLE